MWTHGKGARRLEVDGESLLLVADGAERRLPAGALDEARVAAAVCRLFDHEVLAEARGAVVLARRGAGPAPPPPADRPAIEYRGGHQRGVVGGWTILGRRVRISSPEGGLETTVEALAADGVPDGLLPGREAAALLRAARARAPLACACGTGPPTVDHHGTARILARGQDPSAPVELVAWLAECSVCGCRWVFSEEGDPSYELRQRCRPARV